MPKLYDYPELSEAIIDTIQLPLLVLNEVMTVVRANDAFCRHFGVSVDETVERPLEDLGNGQWKIPALRKLLDEIIPRDGHFENYRVEHDFPRLGHRTMLLNARRISGKESRPALVLLAISDLTELEKARYVLEEQREYAEKLIDSIREALIVLGWDLRVKHANEPFYSTFKVMPADTEGRLIYEIGNRQWDIPELRQLLEDILPKEQSFNDFELKREFESIGFRHMLLNARRLDHLDLILLAIEDITDREESHRRQRLLASEMSHRVKNILTLVDSISAQTARKARSLEEFQHAFHGRLQALARSHGQWLAEASQTVGLHDLIVETAETIGVDLGRIHLGGPPVKIGPGQTMALNLTLHELLTNAIKYGALSAEAGRVELQWSVDNDNLVRLLWQETGGPQIKQPEQEGFGLQLVQTLCPFELEGKAELDFAPSGLRCEIWFPMA